MQVRWKPTVAGELVQDILGWLESHGLQRASGIVYCLTRKDTEAVAEQLASVGLSTAHYHADIDPLVRQNVHQRWCQGMRIIESR